jgi:hypothetical protein
MPSVDVLFRLRKQRPDVFDKVEGELLTSHICRNVTVVMVVYIDGGIRRGTGIYLSSRFRPRVNRGSLQMYLNVYASVLVRSVSAVRFSLPKV